MIKILIVEDDPMVASLNQRYAEKMEGFTITGIAANTEEALQYLAETKIDLILLDVYMPGQNGIDFLNIVRKENEDVDVILITAASDIHQIQQTLRLGAVDYLIKPFEFDRFEKALSQYRAHYKKLTTAENISQKELDTILHHKNPANKPESNWNELPKGLTKNTLKTIHDIILTINNETFSTEDIAEASNISRVSVRKYLKFLAEIDYLEEDLVYGVGRPIYQYTINTANVDMISRFF
ncbi:response regulator [Thalassobacillus pellis]|uniref:response regulator n=1 Tax=Thalassobacillus pellis TaxID=748008 RepID=UPI00195FAC21|nr:response regulator [Thalassobacillus pellis]MBM7552096.1 response regulator of citrate/malate metabolism [Thalassobacillus pellis]